MTPDAVRVVVNSRDFGRFTSYDITGSVFNPPASFALEIGRVDAATLAVLSPGAPLEIYIDVDGVEQLLITGRIEKRSHGYSKGQHHVTISGYDLSRDLMVATAPFDLAGNDRKFIDVCEQAVAPWGIDVALSNELSKWMAVKKADWVKVTSLSKAEYYAAVKQHMLSSTTKESFRAACKAAGLVPPPFEHDGIMKKVKDAKVDPGESVWAFLKRISNKAEQLLWFSPDGMLVVSLPQYEQEPSYILTHRPGVPKENNVISAEETLDIDGIPTSLAVHGKAREKGQGRVPYTALRASTATAPAAVNYHLYRPMAIKDKDARTKAELEKRALYAMKGADKNYQQLTYTVAGHSQDSRVWAYDMTAKVVDETLGIDDVYYIAGWRMTRARTNASAGPQQTMLTLTPLGVWTPE